MTNATTAAEWLTTADVARHLRKPVSWVHNNAETLKIPRVRVGAHYRYRLVEVERWLDAQRVA